MNWIGKIKDVIGIYALWIILHFACSHFYAKLCAGNTLLSILMSPFVAPMPHCVAMRWVIFKGAKVIEIMWFLAGKWVIEQFVVKQLFPEGCSSE
jgi:hypothetical protein